MNPKEKIWPLAGLLVLLAALCLWYHGPKIVQQQVRHPKGTASVVEPIFFEVLKGKDGFAISGRFYDKAQMQSFGALFEQTAPVRYRSSLFSHSFVPDDGLALARDLAPLFCNRFVEGSMEYDGKRFRISGTVRDPRIRETVHKIMVAHTVSSQEKIAVLPIRYTSLELSKKSSGEFTVRGTLSTQKESDTLAAAISTLGIPKTKELRVDSARAPADWLQAVKRILPIFAKDFLSGTVTYNDGTLTIKGVAAADQARKEIEKILKKSGLSYLLQVQLPPSPAVDTPRPAKADAGQEPTEDSRQSDEHAREKEMVENHIKNLLQLENIEFETGSARLTPRGKEVVDRIAAVLDLYDNADVEIAGHTDDVGDARKNLELSKRRVESVKKELVSRGIDPKRLHTVGYGETRPLLPNTSEENRRKNRRVEFRVININ